MVPTRQCLNILIQCLNIPLQYQSVMKPQQTQKRLDSLLNKYDALPDAEQTILQALAVIYQSVRQTVLQNLLRELGLRDSRGKLLSEFVGKALREKFLDLEMLEQDRNGLKCNAMLEEVLAIHAVKNDLYARVVRVIDRVVPLPSARSHYYQPVLTPEQKGRQLRHAFYQEKYDDVLLLLGIEAPFQDLSYERSGALIGICTKPFVQSRFEALPAEIKFQVLAPVLNDGNLHLWNTKEYYDLLEQFVDQGLMEATGGTASLLAEQHLLRGKLDRAETLIATESSSRSMALSAWACALQGQYDVAITHYDAALQKKRKESRKRNLMLTGLPGIYYILALIQTEQNEHLATAEKQLLMARKNKEQDSLDSVFYLLDDFVKILKGPMSLEQSHWLAGHHQSGLQAIFLLFRVLALTWLGEKANQKELDQLSRCCERAYQAGHYWYACESAMTLAWLGEMTSSNKALKYAQDLGFRSLSNLLQPKPAWQRALLALKCLHQVAGAELVTSVDRTSRLIWRLSGDFGGYALHPKEQKLNKNGRWTKGRAVSLKCLYEESECYDFLSEHDRRICQTIHREESWGYYGSATYSLHGVSSLLAAVGHPHIYWEHAASSADSPVEIVRGEPELLVQRENDQLKLQLTPFPELDDGDECMQLKEGPNRLRVVRFSAQHLRIAEIVGEQGLVVPVQAEDQVLESIASIAPILTIHSDIGGVEGVATGAEWVDADSRLHLHLQPAGEGLMLEWYVRPFSVTEQLANDKADHADQNKNQTDGSDMLARDQGPMFRPGEGGSTVLAEIDSKRLQAKRDLQREKHTLQNLIDQCALPVTVSEGGCLLENSEFSLEVLLQLQEMDEHVVLSWPKGKQIKLLREQGVEQLSARVSKERDWFALEGELQLENGDVIAMSQMLELIQQSPGRFVRLANGEVLALTNALRKRLDTIAAHSDQGRFHPLAAHALEEISEGMAVKACKEWKQQLKRLESARTFKPDVPSTLQAQLRDYQLEGYNWLARLAHWGAGACLADDMGLGKTVQALAVILTRAADGPTLIVAPTSVCMNWLDEAQKFAPTLNVIRFGEGDRQQTLDELGAFDLLVCSYGLLQNEAKKLTGVHWHTIVADEAQAIKNGATKRSKAAMSLQGDFKLITTGTPIENHLGELWNLFRFINPGLLDTLDQFNQRFANAIEGDHDIQAKQHLKQLISPFILRRLKSDVLTELPAKTEITLHVELSDEETALYEAMRLRAVEVLSQEEEHPGQYRVKVLAEIMKLRRACCHPKLILPETAISSAKLKAFAAVVSELIESRHKALVFSQFVGHLELIRNYLEEQNIHYQYLDGSTSAKKRRQAVEAFQRGDGDLFLISLKAGGAGLNLTAADYVIHMDPWWNPAVEDQASDRAHRMGQQRPVTIYRMVAKNTIEEKIVALHQQKRDLANSLLEGSEMSGKMSMDEMFDLIKGG